MAKEFDGGIGTDPLHQALNALKDVDIAASELMRILVEEEHASSLYDPDKLKPGSQVCQEIKAARASAENAVGELAKQTAQATTEMKKFTLKVEKLLNAFDKVKVKKTEIGVAGHC